MDQGLSYAWSNSTTLELRFSGTTSRSIKDGYQHVLRKRQHISSGQKWNKLIYRIEKLKLHSITKSLKTAVISSNTSKMVTISATWHANICGGIRNTYKVLVEKHWRKWLLETWKYVISKPNFRSCWICGGQSGTWADSLLVLRFPLPLLKLPNAPCSSIIQDWKNKRTSDRRNKWTVSPPHQLREKWNLNRAEGVVWISQAQDKDRWRLPWTW